MKAPRPRGRRCGPEIDRTITAPPRRRASVHSTHLGLWRPLPLDHNPKQQLISLRNADRKTRARLSNDAHPGRRHGRRRSLSSSPPEAPLPAEELFFTHLQPRFLPGLPLVEGPRVPFLRHTVGSGDHFLSGDMRLTRREGSLRRELDMPLCLMPMFLRHCSMAPNSRVKHGKIPRVDAPVRRQG